MNQGVIGVNSIDGSGPAIGGKGIRGGEVGTREHRQTHRIATYRQGLGLADSRNGVTDPKAVVVRAVSAQASGLHLDAPVAAGVGAEDTASLDRAGCEISLVSNFPLHIQRLREP